MRVKNIKLWGHHNFHKDKCDDPKVYDNTQCIVTLLICHTVNFILVYNHKPGHTRNNHMKLEDFAMRRYKQMLKKVLLWFLLLFVLEKN